MPILASQFFVLLGVFCVGVWGRDVEMCVGVCLCVLV